MVMAAQQCVFPSCHRAVHMKMLRMPDSLMCLSLKYIKHKNINLVPASFLHCLTMAVGFACAHIINSVQCNVIMYDYVMSWNCFPVSFFSSFLSDISILHMLEHLFFSKYNLK